MRGAAVILLLVGLTGCLDRPTEPAASPSSPNEGGVPAQGYGGDLGLANVTSCAGSFLAVPISRDQARGLVGEAYEPFETLPETVTFGVDAYTCSKVAVDGIDRGPGSLMMLRVPIHSPSEFPPPEGYSADVIIEAYTDNPFLRQYFAPLAPAHEGQISHQLVDVAGLRDGWIGSVQSNGSPLYQWTVSSDNEYSPDGANIHMYGVGRPVSLAISAVNRGVTSNILGSGVFLASEGTALADVVGQKGLPFPMALRVEEDFTLFSYAEAVGT